MDKFYQVADWRIRPLKKELLQYAREDSHYLIAIYISLMKLINPYLFTGGSKKVSASNQSDLAFDSTLYIPAALQDTTKTLHKGYANDWLSNIKELYEYAKAERLGSRLQEELMVQLQLKL